MSTASPAQLLAELRELNEHPTIEAKRAREIGPSVMQTVCAFANEPGLGGGYLLLGVAEPDADHDNFWVAGVESPDNLLNTLQTNCRDQFEAPVPIKYLPARLEGKQILMVFVPELDPAAKPCTFKGGAGPATYYQLAELPNLPLFDAANASEVPQDTSDLAEDTSDLAEDTSDLPPNASNLSGESESLPSNLQHRLEALTPRARKENLWPAILWLCSIKACTAEELAKTLRRKVTPLKTGHLTQLRKSGYLAYRYPEVVNHPQQAYETTRKGRAWLQSRGVRP